MRPQPLPGAGSATIASSRCSVRRSQASSRGSTADIDRAAAPRTAGARRGLAHAAAADRVARAISSTRPGRDAVRACAARRKPERRDRIGGRGGLPAHPEGHPGAGLSVSRRIWNYFPRINVESDGLERYRAFCVGPRHGRLDDSASRECDRTRPGLLSSRRRAASVEQVSAYRYPALYGPRSPLFSRAVVKQWARSTQLYISGTASVVGHWTP